ncbi:MAG: hypothetical protein OEZ02_11155 [Anaerolineae bacterium]|nr:hypothetical protein [Anaerolineae bacterium]
MTTIGEQDIQIIMALALFLLGLTTFITGVFVLLTRAMGKDMSTLAAQAKHLAQKGIAEDVAGLVGNASALMTSMQEMARTAAGIGVLLNLFGLLLMAASYALLTGIDWPITF